MTADVVVVVVAAAGGVTGVAGEVAVTPTVAVVEVAGRVVAVPDVTAASVTVRLTVTVLVTVRVTSCSGGATPPAGGPGASPRTTEIGADASPMCSPDSRITDQVSPAASTIPSSASTAHKAPRPLLIQPNVPRGRLSTGKAPPVGFG